MADFVIRKGDLLPELQATLTDQSGEAVDLTNTTGVRFHLRSPSQSSAKVASPATVVTPADGIVRYVWSGTDTDTPGRYWAEFEVTFSDGRKQTFPNPGYLSVLITEQLA